MANDIIPIGHDGCLAAIWTLGAAVNSVYVPDRSGRIAPVVLGYDSADDRLFGEFFAGEIVGPVANRIAGGRYSLDGAVHTTARNDRGQTLHSGPAGLHRRTWEVLDRGPGHVLLGCDWPADAEGFPGPIHIEVLYSVAGSTVRHEVVATTAAPTVVNIVSHPYFNLSGRLGPVTDHELQVWAASYLPVNDCSIPLASSPERVVGSLDLRQPRLLGDVVDSEHPQIKACGGLDHAFLLDPAAPGLVRPAAFLRHPPSGRTLRIETDQPSLQVYTGQGLGEADTISTPKGIPVPYCGVALETQDLPDAPNRPDFPSVVLRPGEVYRRVTDWVFGLD
ncbi:MAG: galactose mutarotase [Propionibacteriaceae bacterium]|jgi:aldose 1-epimerase|nr:galactose mutarotase [Propionibacteriaceae bacterium]